MRASDSAIPFGNITEAVKASTGIIRSQSTNILNGMRVFRYWETLNIKAKETIYF